MRVDGKTIGDRFRAATAEFDPHRPILVLTHNDADGLSAGAIFARALARLGRSFSIRILGRGENPWSPEMTAELAAQEIGGLIVTDLGSRPGPLKPGTPTVIVDHHVPTGTPEGATLITGYEFDPVPTSSLLAFWCAGALTNATDLLWLAAIGLVGDLGDKAPFTELADAKTLYTATAIREAVSLVNAPRRTGSGDAGPAFALLLGADNPKDAISGRHPETARLEAARQEVKAALEQGKRVAPRLIGEIALVTLDSPCQIHPLVAQTWRSRLKDKIVIVANTGYRPGWVHFAARSATGRNLIAFLRDKAPAGADENYGNGHEQATGGALRLDGWAEFLGNLGLDQAARLSA